MITELNDLKDESTRLKEELVDRQHNIIEKIKGAIQEVLV